MSEADFKENGILFIKCTSNIVSECRVKGYYKKEPIGDQIYITEAKDKKAIPGTREEIVLGTENSIYEDLEGGPPTLLESRD